MPQIIVLEFWFANFTLCANSLPASKAYTTIDFTLCANSIAWNPYSSVVQISSYLRTHTLYANTVAWNPY